MFGRSLKIITGGTAENRWAAKREVAGGLERECGRFDDGRFGGACVKIECSELRVGRIGAVRVCVWRRISGTRIRE